MGKLNLGYNHHEYNFYGAPAFYQNMDRTVHDFSGDARIDLHAGDKASIGLIGGGMYGKIDDARLLDVPFNSLKGSAQARAFVGRHMLTAGLEAARHSYEPDLGIIDGSMDPDQSRSLKSFKAQIGFEGTVRRGLHLRVGGAFYNTEDVTENKISRFYPYVSLSKALPGVGEVFADFSPEIISQSILERIQINRFLNASSELSYTDYPINLKAGWRKRAANGMTFEIAYLYKKVEHLGIEIDDSIDGLWQLSYGGMGESGYKSTLQGIQFVTDWQLSDQFTLWGATSVLDYSQLDGVAGGKIPYHANVTGSGMLQFRPGYGLRLELSGKYVGSRSIDVWGSRDLDPYVLLNFHLGKRFGNNFEAGVSVYNIFNQKFEIRDMYREPDMVSAGVVKMYW